MIDPYIRKALITNVVDGDTVDAVIDLGYNVTTTQRIRLLGINTPERGQAGSVEATAHTRSRLWAQHVYIKSKKSDHFGRYLGEILFEDGTSFNQELVDKGLAVPYMV